MKKFGPYRNMNAGKVTVSSTSPKGKTLGGLGNIGSILEMVNTLSKLDLSALSGLGNLFGGKKAGNPNQQVQPNNQPQNVNVQQAPSSGNNNEPQNATATPLEASYPQLNQQTETLLAMQQRFTKAKNREMLLSQMESHYETVHRLTVK